ncbi:MAG: LPS-assembly protein LptD [Pseudomonadota bacterium]
MIVPRPTRLAALSLAAALCAMLAPAAAQEEGEPPRGLGALMQAEAEGPVSLVADRVNYQVEAETLIAEGNVEVYYGPRTLTAARIVYDRKTNRISAEGPLRLRGPEGVTLLADFAELDPDLRDGLIEGARAVMRHEAKFAALRGERIDGRYNVLTRAVFSPCRVCAEDPVPLWRIRAERIVHDEEARQVHYEDATFEVLGVPVLWTPYFRHPDPTLERASGFLPPEYMQSSTFGHAVRQPYYWAIDEHSDATFAPIMTTGDGLLAEGEYRRRFRSGALKLRGSVSYQDYDGEDRLRGHVFGQGLWNLTERVQAGFQLEQASDDAYMRRYDFSDRDRLTSELFVRASDSRGWGEVSLVRFQSLRDDEPFGEIPVALPTFEGRRIWTGLPMVGGELGLDAAGYALKRTSGTDTLHGSAGLDWERSWVEGRSGVEITAHAGLRADVWEQGDVEGDRARDERIAPLAAIEARLPLLRRDAEGDALSGLLGEGGVTHLLEPVAQGVIAPYFGEAPPNEDSLLVEFDETSLFSLRRHTGFDGFEEGPRLNLGLRYARISDDGTRLSAALGRVYRPESIDSFVEGTGLNATESDFVGAWSLRMPGRLTLANRLRVSDEFELERNEIYASGAWRGLDFAGSYVYLAEDAVNPRDRHEVSAESRYAITPNWFVGAELQRDLEAGEWIRTRGTIGYANECVDVAFYAGRRFTETEDAPASTFYGVRVNLWALGGAPGPAAPSGACAPRTE